MRGVAAHSTALDIQNVLDIQEFDGAYGSKAVQLQLMPGTVCVISHKLLWRSAMLKLSAISYLCLV